MKQHDGKTVGIRRRIFRSELLLIIVLAAVLAAVAIIIVAYVDTRKQDIDLKNTAEAISILVDEDSLLDTEQLTWVLDTLKDNLTNIDVISVVGKDLTRLYHSNHDLIGTTYDGTLPDFDLLSESSSYAYHDYGPSGNQRRAYAAIYDRDGEYVGFVLIAMLVENLRSEILSALVVIIVVTLAAVLVEFMISYLLSRRIKRELMGYEPGVFSAMFRIRDNILESLGEGIIAVDKNSKVQFYNAPASRMLGIEKNVPDGLGDRLLGATLKSGLAEHNINEHGFPTEHILMDRIPIKEEENVIGAVGILHDRTTYMKMQEELTGAQYLVDSMRANNHDFTNKLHVILGLLQMKLYDKAMSYIEGITIVQRQTISAVMSAVDDPALAALLIGKISRANELSIKLVLQEGSCCRRADFEIPGEALVTIVGNLIDNSLEAVNAADPSRHREVMIGIFTRPGAMLIIVDDSGEGIAEENLNKIFENGFSTKGEGRGTGLYQVKKLVESLGGTIFAESNAGAGTSFTVSFGIRDKKGEQ